MKSTERHDQLAAVYDFGTLRDWFYRPARRQAVNQLRLSEGDAVFDIFCGTGASFELLTARVGTSGHIVGVDGSTKMLKQARREADRVEARPDQIALMQADFTTEQGVRELTGAIRNSRARKFLFALGLTCLPNWRAFTAAVFDAAAHGSRFSIMDVYNERLSPGARLMNWIASSETRRPVWKELERRSIDFAFERRPFRVLNAMLEVSMIVGSGTKSQKPPNQPTSKLP